MPAKTAAKARSVTLYLGDEVINKLDFFADATVRSKSQAAEYLIRMGMEQFVETSQTQPKDEPTVTPKPKRRGAKKSIASTVEKPAKATAPKPVVKKPVARKPAVKKPAARKPAARKPRAKAAA